MKMSHKDTIILGGGISGLTAGCFTGFPIFEAKNSAGGMCASYYVRPQEKKALLQPPCDQEAYRFEIGGGHWIFGADEDVLKFICSFVAVKKYKKLSAVYFSKSRQLVPYPLQHNLQYLDKIIANKVLKESLPSHGILNPNMEKWLTATFGLTLCKLFFYPFHNLYTAGLYKNILPQNQYKSPRGILLNIKNKRRATDYNACFIYPKDGMDALIRALAEENDIRYRKRVVSIDTKLKKVCFADNSSVSYKRIISTLPLNKILKIAGLNIGVAPDPYTSVLVINIGAIKGKNCPAEHWLYIPDPKSGFYRVGFYSNVDSSFLPRSSRIKNDRVAIYAERAFVGGLKPSANEIDSYSSSVIDELQKWGFIKDVEVKNPTWIDVAYTWSWQSSDWRKKALQLLADNSIYQIGRYGKWRFQGIAESIKDGIQSKNIIK